MDTPEGFKICFDVDTSTDRGREMVDFALNLMKEMAEAGEDMYVIGGHKQSERFKDVWRKWKEWR